MTGDPIESGGLVDLDRVLITPEGKLVLPLTRVVASCRREFLSAEGDWTRRRSFGIPTASAAQRFYWYWRLNCSIGANIELLPNILNSIGLTVPPESSQSWSQHPIQDVQNCVF